MAAHHLAYRRRWHDDRRQRPETPFEHDQVERADLYDRQARREIDRGGGREEVEAMRRQRYEFAKLPVPVDMLAVVLPGDTPDLQRTAG